jgi:hypothetical protein
MQLKLDELIRVNEIARNSLINLQTPPAPFVREPYSRSARHASGRADRDHEGRISAPIPM